MNMLEVFWKFYNSMDTFSLFVFWIAIFAFFFLIFLSISLYLKNKELVDVIENIKKNKEKKQVIEPIFDKKEEVVEKIKETKEETKQEIKEVKKEVVEGPYSKNVLRNVTSRHQTSPISIKKDNDVVNIETVSVDEVEEIKVEKKNLSFAEEISKRMEEELKPETIELTDYEKKQEEEAIISYQELLSASKDRLYNITDDEETVDFINELKSFRSSL